MRLRALLPKAAPPPSAPAREAYAIQMPVSIPKKNATMMMQPTIPVILSPL
jgi:hypothetical protein